jgi:hypothetical protein
MGFGAKSAEGDLKPQMLKLGVAQSGRAPVLGTGGRGFESLHPDQGFYKKTLFLEMSPCSKLAYVTG